MDIPAPLSDVTTTADTDSSELADTSEFALGLKLYLRFHYAYVKIPISINVYTEPIYYVTLCILYSSTHVPLCYCHFICLVFFLLKPFVALLRLEWPSDNGADPRQAIDPVKSIKPLQSTHSYISIFFINMHELSPEKTVSHDLIFPHRRWSR